VERPDAGTTRRPHLVRPRLEPQGGAVLSIAPSQRNKSFATGRRRGQRSGSATRRGEQVLLRLAEGAPGRRGDAFSPRDDGVVGIDAGRRAAHWRIAAHRRPPRDDLQARSGTRAAGALHLAVVVGHGLFEPKFSWCR
jgi:hypothetical protein